MHIGTCLSIPSTVASLPFNWGVLCFCSVLLFNLNIVQSVFAKTIKTMAQALSQLRVKVLMYLNVQLIQAPECCQKGFLFNLMKSHVTLTHRTV